MRNRERYERFRGFLESMSDEYARGRKDAHDKAVQQRYGEAQTALLFLLADTAYAHMTVTARLYEQILTLFPDHDTDFTPTESSVDQEDDEPAEVAETVGAAPEAEDLASAPHPNAPDPDLFSDEPYDWSKEA